jgi:hypothetical protein
MTKNAHRRDSAIQAYRRREADQAQAKAASREEVARTQRVMTEWANVAAPMIRAAVSRCAEDFARRDSPFHLDSEESEDPRKIEFRVRRRNVRGSVARLTFSLANDGIVRAESDARGTTLPQAVLVDTVTAQWANNAAEQVMLAVLKS